MSAEGYDEIRSGVRALCAEFPDAYFRKIDSERGYPVDFVAALTKAGWLAALIPAEYGGFGLGPPPTAGVVVKSNQLCRKFRALFRQPVLPEGLLAPRVVGPQSGRSIQGTA